MQVDVRFFCTCAQDKLKAHTPMPSAGSSWRKHSASKFRRRNAVGGTPVLAPSAKRFLTTLTPGRTSRFGAQTSSSTSNEGYPCQSTSWKRATSKRGFVTGPGKCACRLIVPFGKSREHRVPRVDREQHPLPFTFIHIASQHLQQRSIQHAKNQSHALAWQV